MCVFECECACVCCVCVLCVRARARAVDVDVDVVDLRAIWSGIGIPSSSSKFQGVWNGFFLDNRSDSDQTFLDVSAYKPHKAMVKIRKSEFNFRCIFSEKS